MKNLIIILFISISGFLNGQDIDPLYDVHPGLESAIERFTNEGTDEVRFYETIDGNPGIFIIDNEKLSLSRAYYYRNDKFNDIDYWTVFAVYYKSQFKLDNTPYTSYDEFETRVYVYDYFIEHNSEAKHFELLNFFNDQIIYYARVRNSASKARYHHKISSSDNQNLITDKLDELGLDYTVVINSEPTHSPESQQGNSGEPQNRSAPNDDVYIFEDIGLSNIKWYLNQSIRREGLLLSDTTFTIEMTVADSLQSWIERISNRKNVEFTKSN